MQPNPPLKIEYEHKGTKIEFLYGSGKFVATIKGSRVTTPSLSAIQKQIDDAAKTKFEPFTAFCNDYGREERTRVVGIKKGRQYKEDEWVLDNGRTARYVFADTEENSEVRMSAKKYRTETNKIEAQRRIEQEKLDKKIVRLYPKTYKA